MVFKVKGNTITPAEMQAKKEAKEKQKAKATPTPMESTEITDVYKPAKAKKAKSTTKKKSSL